MENMENSARLSELAKLMNVFYSTVYRWCDEGKVATIMLPSGQRRILRSEVDRLLASVHDSEA